MFPTFNPTRLCHTLQQMGFCPNVTHLISNFLSCRSTTFQLENYQSQPKLLTIDLPKGSPLSVFLYILYNTPLLRQADGLTDMISLGFIDNVAFSAARPTVKEVQEQL